MTTDSNNRSPKRIVVALGGNAISRSNDDSVPQDYLNLQRSLDAIVPLIQQGHEVILTHGNGPQVGNQMIRVELARGQAPDLPLDLMVADLQGGLGYMIERVLRNKLLRAGAGLQPVCAMLTLVEVDRNDPALSAPTKFVGPAYEFDSLAEHQAKGWVLKEDVGRGWRRVVPSPIPISIVEQSLIRTLIEAGAVVIVTGGGGIPVARTERGLLEGVEAVVDKDLASSVLGNAIDASELYILTAVDCVYLDFGTPDQRPLSQLTANEARSYLRDGFFPAGSMGPKVEAACSFVERGGRRSLITDIFRLDEALDGKVGTWITA